MGRLVSGLGIALSAGRAGEEKLGLACMAGPLECMASALGELALLRLLLLLTLLLLLVCFVENVDRVSRDRGPEGG